MKMRPLPNAVIRAAGLTCIVLSAAPANYCMAAGTSTAWRGTYDSVMVWVNFVILAALLIKLLKKPLRDFFGSQRDTVTKELDALTNQKQQAEANIAAFRLEMEARQDRFAEIHQKILDSGEKERQEIIETARRQAAIMIESARQRIDHRLRDAENRLRGELIDAAMSTALSQLPDRIEPEDDHQWVDRFIQDIDKSSL